MFKQTLLKSTLFKKTVPPLKSLLNPSKIPSTQQFIKNIDGFFLQGVTRFHEITGYSEIESIKQELNLVNLNIVRAREKVRASREAYNNKIMLRAKSQKEINELLIRKTSWQPLDLEKFTELYKNDHVIQKEIMDAKAAYDDCETELEDLTMKSGQLMGSRYREEQLWSDKIRQASTWGTWVLMGFNILLFILVQLVLEPWKRRRLVNSFQQKVHDMLIEERQESVENEVVFNVQDICVWGLGVFTFGIVTCKFVLSLK